MDLQNKSWEGRPKGTGCECSCCGARPPEEHPQQYSLPPWPRGPHAFPGRLRLFRLVVSQRHSRPLCPFPGFLGGTFMCFRRELGCVYDLSHILHR